MSEVVITVRGEHEVRIAPEQGVVSVAVTADGPERGPVVERVAALAAPIRDDLTARADQGTLEDWSSQRADIWASRPWSNDGTQLALVHHASVDFTATFSDFAALSWWLSEVAGRDGVQVGGVAWQLTPASRAAVEADVATRAVQVAVGRATAYASALGLQSVTPLEVADLGLLSRGGSEIAGAAPRMMHAMAASPIDGGPAVEFHPDDIVVTAGVEARFSAR